MPTPYPIADQRAFADTIGNANYPTDTFGQHVSTGGSPPTVTAGTAASVSVVPGSTDFAGSINASPAATATTLFTVTFSRTFTVAPTVVISAQTTTAQAGVYVVGTVTPTSFTVFATAAPVVAPGPMVFDYIAVGIGGATS